jgi:hypothetical protein
MRHVVFREFPSVGDLRSCDVDSYNDILPRLYITYRSFYDILDQVQYRPLIVQNCYIKLSWRAVAFT